MQNDTRKLNSGFATLLAVLIVGAIGAAVAISFLNRGVEASKNSNSIESAYEARLLADECAELALQGVRNNGSYVGKGNSSNDKGACTYEVVSMGGTRKNITATGNVKDVVKKILVEIEGINPKIIIVSWHEVL